MAQCRSTTRSREALTARTELDRERDNAPSLVGDGPRTSSTTSPGLQRRPQSRNPSGTKPKAVKATYKTKTNVERRRIILPVHSNMKTKQVKEDSDRTVDEETVSESSAKTRSRKKAAAEAAEEERSKLAAEADSKASKKNIRNKVTKKVVRKRPLGIQKTLRNKKIVVVKDKLKKAIKQTSKRGRKTAIKTEPISETEEKDTPALVAVTEIKEELIEEVYPNSRSSSPKTAGRRPRVSSDMAMMKSVLGDSPSTLVLGPRTSPYSTRSERSNSPSIIDNNRRSGRPRKLKTNLLNEVVKNEQKKRRRLLSDSKTGDVVENLEENRKSKRGRSCSRDDSELSKCSDVSESDTSLIETPSVDIDKESDKKIDKTKTDLVVENKLNLQISTDSEKVPSLDAAVSPVVTSDINLSPAPQEKTKRKLSLKRSTSLDSDNNNSNRLKLENIRNSADIDDKSNISIKTENDTLFSDRSSILTSMSKTFNSKEVSKNIRRARRNIKAAAVRRTSQPQPKVVQSTDSEAGKNETLESISKEINDLIQTLDVSDAEPVSEDLVENFVKPDAANQIKSVTKFYNLPEVKPLTDNNSLIIGSETILKDKDVLNPTESSTPVKSDDSENMRLHFEGDEESPEKSCTTKEITYKCPPITASIDKLMDRLKTFEEFDKKRQHELMKSNESKSVMVTNDVVLIPKSGVDVKPLKDIQPAKSPEKPIEKENVLSCFENNSAISIVKRDQVRKSVDVDLPNSVTLIKRNSISTRKESTGSNPSRESTDAISIFEKSLGKDVTLTEIRKSADKSTPSTPVELHQFATLHPNNPVTNSLGISLDSTQISIMPRVPTSDVTKQANTTDIQLKRHSRDSLPSKLSESGNDMEPEKMATIERIKSPIPVGNQQMKPPITITSLPPVAVKSPEVVQPMETEVLAPPLESVKMILENMPLTSEVPTTEVKDTQALITKIAEAVPNGENSTPAMPVQTLPVNLHENVKAKSDIDDTQDQTDTKTEVDTKSKENYKKPPKSPVKGMRSKRVSSENQPGPSSAFAESPENQRKKENVLRTLGLITHKAAKEARIMKQKEKERIYGKSYVSGLVHKPKTAKTISNDYTGTLKTVIKLNRTSGERDKGKKYKTSLKMTFQKSKNRNGKPLPDVEAAGTDDTYYTIERREGATTSSAAIEAGHRKSHYSNRLNHDTTSQESTAELSADSGKEATLNLVIPEKASSFSIHPGRLCMDQCFYCGGKFGLFDTPCHIAQMKSTERQKKVLDNEEKLTIDSCLCDACYRHVDRRANCPSYRRNKPAARAPSTTAVYAPTAANTTANTDANALEKLSSLPLDEESDEENGGGSYGPSAGPETRPVRCHTAGCISIANHDIPRKWLIKMRSSVNKLLKLELDYPGLHSIPLCTEHYRALTPLMVCVLCRRRITKLHKVHTISQDYEELNPLLSEVGIPVQFTERPVLCKLCRYYCSLLQRPTHNIKHERGYRRRLLQLYNVDVPPDSEVEDNYNISQQSDEILNNSKQKKKAKTKSKQRKYSDLKQDDCILRDRTSESSPEKNLREDSNDYGQKPHQNMEEDIESLISSNKILVPGASKPSSAEPSLQSDNSDTETLVDYDAPLLPLDKQTELQYLLQKQNNPAQFLQKPNVNLTQKQKSMLKIHSSIQKPGHQHRIHEKNAKRIQKLGQIVTHKEKPKSDILEMIDIDKPKEAAQGVSLLRNVALNEECTIETVPNKKPADINILKNKWQMSESFTQVKKNLSELSKNLSGEKITKKTSDTRYLNPVKRLETNPSISVRELFPGEEEMNLQCNIEFNNVRGVTPEGWEKCNTTIQYDVETKRLWNELQRPYGNQSSFLRHLVLLEKYFRNGDLILAHNATMNAVNYSDSVQSRLKAYDNATSDAPKKCEPAISLIEYRKQKPTATPVPTNGKSLLKSNQITSDSEKPKSPEGSKKQFLTPTSIPKSKPNKTESKNKTKPLPPELIAINTPNAQGRKAIQNVLHNIQQLVKGVSAADPTEVAAAPLPHQAPRVEQPKKQKTTKPWRPTLMPITQENLARIAREPLQLAVDGRSLPSLVQVMSSGNRYHITLQDYNKMCVMRREKLQQLHDGDSKRRDDTTLITEIQPSAMLGNGGTLKQTIPSMDKFECEKSKDIDLGQIGTSAATILKNVGLKNITIAPIPAKPATVTSLSLTTTSSQPSSLLIAGAPVKMPQLGPAVSITSESVTSSLPMLTSGPIQITGSMVMPKIPKSLTVIPQMMPTTTVAPVVNAPATDKIQGALVPLTSAQVTTTTDTTRP